jgi:hypothetical protein
MVTKELSSLTDESQSTAATACPMPRTLDWSGVTRVELSPKPPLAHYLEAMALAGQIATERLGDFMLLSWYDRDRDFESPQHAGECHLGGAIPGYMDYGINRGATLCVDLEGGRFVFFYLPIDL